MPANNRVVLTGSTGFTGKYLKEYLTSSGYQVFGISVHATPQINEHTLDLANSPVLDSVLADIAPAYVIHLGALSFAAHDDYREVYQANLFGSINLIDSLAKISSITKVVVASSASVYGAPNELPLHEDSACAPQNHYAISKLAMEHAFAAYCRLPTIIVRPFNYTGVGQAKNFLVPKIIEAFRARRPEITLGNLQIERDFADVRDVVRMYAGLIASDICSGTFNICSGRSMSIGRVVDLAAQVTGHKLTVKQSPSFMRASDPEQIVGSSEKLSEFLSVECRPFAETIEWMCNN